MKLIHLILTGEMFLRLLEAFGGFGGSLMGLAFVAFQVATSQIGARDHRDLSNAPGSALPEGRIRPWRIAAHPCKEPISLVVRSLKTFLYELHMANMQHGI